MKRAIQRIDGDARTCCGYRLLFLYLFAYPPDKSIEAQENLWASMTLDGSVELEPHSRPEGTGRLLSVRN